MRDSLEFPLEVGLLRHAFGMAVSSLSPVVGSSSVILHSSTNVYTYLWNESDS